MSTLKKLIAKSPDKDALVDWGIAPMLAEQMVEAINEGKKMPEKAAVIGLMRAPEVENPRVADVPVSPVLNQTVKTKRKYWWIGGAILLLIGLGLFLWQYSSDEEEDKGSYLLTKTINIRSTNDFNSKTNIFPEKLKFGDRVEKLGSVVGTGIKIRKEDLEGWVSDKYLGSKADFEKVKGVFHQPGPFDEIHNARFMRGVLDYFEEQEWVGVLDSEVRDQFDPDGSKQVWQVPNQKFERDYFNFTTLSRVNFDGDESTEGMVILVEEIESTSGKLLYLDYSNTGDYSAKVMGDWEVAQGMGLCRFPRSNTSNKFFLPPGYGSLPSDGILLRNEESPENYKLLFQENAKLKFVDVY